MVQPMVDKAKTIVGTVTTFAGVSLVAGMWLWGLLFYPFVYERWWTWTLVGLVGLVFLLPSGLLYAFVLGLRQLIELPEELVARTSQGEMQAQQAYHAAVQDPSPQRVRRFGRLLRSVWELRSLVMDSKGLLIQYAALVRLVNPFSLLLLLGALVAGVVLVGSALLGTLLVAVF